MAIDIRNDFASYVASIANDVAARFYVTRNVARNLVHSATTVRTLHRRRLWSLVDCGQLGGSQLVVERRQTAQRGLRRGTMKTHLINELDLIVLSVWSSIYAVA